MLLVSFLPLSVFFPATSLDLKSRFHGGSSAISKSIKSIKNLLTVHFGFVLAKPRNSEELLQGTGLFSA
jgi:hypothetical protein